jgi:hypothetical protein
VTLEKNVKGSNPKLLKHSSDILPIWFKHTRIIRFFGLFLKYLKILDTKANFQAFVYNAFLKILENTSFWAPSKNTRISYVTTMS